MRAPGSRATCYLTDFNETLPVLRVYGPLLVNMLGPNKPSKRWITILFREFCMEMFDGGKWQRQHYFNFIFGIVAQFLVW